jgi:hypothetical protein
MNSTDSAVRNSEPFAKLRYAHVYRRVSMGVILPVGSRIFPRGASSRVSR